MIIYSRSMNRYGPGGYEGLFSGIAYAALRSMASSMNGGPL